jgi:sRNA-binding protein
MSARDRKVIEVAIALLVECFPQCFAIYEKRRRPLKIGIHLDIRDALDGAITPNELSNALGAYCSNSGYLYNTRAGTARIEVERLMPVAAAAVARYMPGCSTLRRMRALSVQAR